MQAVTLALGRWHCAAGSWVRPAPKPEMATSRTRARLPLGTAGSPHPGAQRGGACPGAGPRRPPPRAPRAGRRRAVQPQCRSPPPPARTAPPRLSRPPVRPRPATPVPCCPGPSRTSGCARDSERRGGAGGQGPAEESGGPGRLPEGRPRVDAAGAGSLEQPAPSLPPGALWLEGKRARDGAAGGPGPRQVAGRRELLARGRAPRGLSVGLLARGGRDTASAASPSASWAPPARESSPQARAGSARSPPRGPGAGAGPRRSPEGSYLPAPEPGSPGRAARLSDRPRGERPLGNSAFVRPGTFQVLGTEAKDLGGRFRLRSHRPAAAVLGPEFLFV